MSFYMMTEQEKVDLVKNFSKRYTPWIVGFLLLLVIGFSSFAYWQSHRTSRDHQASQLYQRMLMLDQKNQEQAVALATSLIQDYSDLQYANWSALYLAASHAEQRHFEEAQQQLNFVLEHHPTAMIKNLTLMRLSEILIELNQLEEAKQMLNRLDPEFALLKSSLLSEIYELQNNIELARENNTQVLNDTLTEPLLQDWFRMKLNHLPTKGS